MKKHLKDAIKTTVLNYLREGIKGKKVIFIYYSQKMVFYEIEISNADIVNMVTKLVIDKVRKVKKYAN